MATAQPTTDHDTIREWVESRGGHPARVKRTGNRRDPGVLRIDFPGFSGEDTLEEIEWEQFFEWFDRDKLALLLSDEEGNRFNKFVSRATARKAAASSKKASSSKKSAGSSKKTSSSSKKTAGSSKKASSSAKKAAGSTKKASTSTKKAAGSTKKASTSTKKAAGSTKKASTSTTKASTSTKKASSKKTSSKASSSKKISSKKTSKKAASTSSNTTTDHDEIRSWVEARGGFPAHVRQTGRKRGDLGVLRIDYPGYSGKDTLERIDWEDWFEAFERNKLAFLYQDKRNSRFSKLVNR